MKKITLVLLIIAALAQVTMAGEFAGTFTEAKAKATELGKPLLIDFFADWCGPCKRFAAATQNDADIQKAIEAVVLWRIDAEKGDGIALAKEYKINSYPTFVMVNKGGEIIDRWSGYSKEYFLGTLPDALADLSTITEKKARYQATPDLRSAVVLGRYASAMGEYKDAVAFYQKAQALNADSKKNYSTDIFESTYEGAAKGLFSYDEMASAADNAIRASKDPMETYMVSSQMAGFSKQHEKNADVSKYLQYGLDATANSDNADLVQAHKSLMVDFSLLVKNDTATAVEYKKAIMPTGWMEDPGQLNGFAWWCFENMANLKEAEQLSRKSVELAKPGKEKAMNLDTLAEILHAQGSTSEAVETSKLACKEDSASKYYPSQVERFQKAMAEKK
jgi:thiol-disulfide isomerase/thioredoxin